MAESTWEIEKKFEEGDVVIEITSQPGKFGKKYSITVGRKATNRETNQEYSSRFLRPPDLDTCRRLIDEADLYLTEEKEKVPRGR